MREYACEILFAKYSPDTQLQVHIRIKLFLIYDYIVQ